MDKLIEMLEYYMTACITAKDHTTKRTFFDQATGAMQMYCYLNIQQEYQVVGLWDMHYRPEFEKIVYGV